MKREKEQKNMCENRPLSSWQRQHSFENPIYRPTWNHFPKLLGLNFSMPSAFGKSFVFSSPITYLELWQQSMHRLSARLHVQRSSAMWKKYFVQLCHVRSSSVADCRLGVCVFNSTQVSVQTYCGSTPVSITHSAMINLSLCVPYLNFVFQFKFFFVVFFFSVFITIISNPIVTDLFSTYKFHI